MKKRAALHKALMIIIVSFLFAAPSGNLRVVAAGLSSSSSDNIPCASGTTFWKDVEVGGKYKIKLCKVTSMTSSSGWGPSDAPAVNSRVSKVFAEFGADFKSTTGKTLNVSDAFRPNYAQKYYYDCSKGARTSYTNDRGTTKTCDRSTFSRPAEPGTSNHEMGLAIDIDNICGGLANGSTCYYQGHNIDELLTRHGLARNVSNDPEHVNVASGGDTSENGTSSSNQDAIGDIENSGTSSSSDKSEDGGSAATNSEIAEVNKGSCASILKSFCSEDGTVDLGSLLGMIITILTGAIVIAGTVGIIICGFLWMTARDNEGQVAQAKKRMLDIVIGIIAWVLLALLANLFIPRTTDDIESNVAGNTGIDAIKPVKTEPTTPQTPSGDNNSSNNNGGNPATSNSTTPVKPLNKDSSGVACAAGTTDLGTTTEAYNQGTRITIRLCSIPTIKQSSDVGDGHNDGHIHVNSRVSGAYYALGKKYQDTHNGASLSATQSFRTMAKQQYFWGCYQQRLNGVSKPCNNGNNAARPGYSNHQLGTAVDFEMNGSGWSNTGVSGFFYQHLSTYGLDRPLTIQKVGDDDDECWHVAPK